MRVFSLPSSWLAVLVAVLIAATIYGKPYQAPLQGILGGKRTLVLFDDLGAAQFYSSFFSSLKSRGHTLTYQQAESEDITLRIGGKYIYDNIILFCPTVDKFGTYTIEDLLQFSNEGGNVIIGANREAGSTIRDLAEAYGVTFHKKGSEVIDHFQFDSDADTSVLRTSIRTSVIHESRAMLGKYLDVYQSTPVMYRGIGHSIEKENILAFTFLRGNPTTYSASPNKSINDSPESVGTETLLVSGVQARNNARVLVSGSLDLFSNVAFQTGGNSLFCEEAAKWALGERGVLRFRDITHHKIDGSPPDVILHEKERPDLPLSLYPDPEITRNSLVYRIKDEIVYSMIVEEFEDGQWRPFVANDMQLEFVMLDPYIRKTLTTDPTSGRFMGVFTAPDSYGIFKFRVLYRRPGYSVLHAETQVSIRPFKHNEYERFIFSAYPYYSSVISATVAFVVFLFAIMFSSDSKKVVTK